MLHAVESAEWRNGLYFARLFAVLSDRGYHRVVVNYRNKHQEAVDSDVESWAQTGRALGR